MKLLDVNVLVFAFRQDLPEHASSRGELERLVGGRDPFSIPDVVASGFVRIVTHPKVLDPPASTDMALEFLEAVRSADAFRFLTSGPALFDRFASLCRETKARGNAVPDALLAAIALEADAELITADRGFARFKGLRSRAPAVSS